MCDKIKDGSGNTYPHEHIKGRKCNLVFIITPLPPDEKEMKLLEEIFTNEEVIVHASSNCLNSNTKWRN
jgi:hypothetical protein